MRNAGYRVVGVCVMRRRITHDYCIHFFTVLYSRTVSFCLRARGHCVATSRREFLKTASAAAATIGVNACVGSQQPPVHAPRPASTEVPAASTTADSSFRDLAMLALDAARSAGAQYADVRISRNRVQSISTREIGWRSSE